MKKKIELVFKKKEKKRGVTTNRSVMCKPVDYTPIYVYLLDYI